MVLLLPRRARGAAAPALTVSDNFNRADGGLGANWTTLPGSSGAPQIASNVVVATPTGVERSAGWTADTFNANQYAQVQATFSTGTRFRFVQVICRASTADNTYYFLMVDTSNNYSIRKMVAGVETVLSGMVPDGALIGGGAITFRLEVNGSSIEAFKNGVSIVGPVTDTSIPATGSPGFMTFALASGTGTVTLDNFEAGNL